MIILEKSAAEMPCKNQSSKGIAEIMSKLVKSGGGCEGVDILSRETVMLGTSWRDEFTASDRGCRAILLFWLAWAGHSTIWEPEGRRVKSGWSDDQRVTRQGCFWQNSDHWLVCSAGLWPRDMATWLSQHHCPSTAGLLKFNTSSHGQPLARVWEGSNGGEWRRLKTKWTIVFGMSCQVS